MTTKPKFLSRDEILSTDDRQTEVVDVSAWKGAVKVRSLSGVERGKYEASMMKYRRTPAGGLELAGVDTDNQRARLVSLSVVDDDGKRLFEEKDLLALGEKDGEALDQIFKVAVRLSHLNPENIEALKTGLKAVPSGSSGSDSPETSG